MIEIESLFISQSNSRPALGLRWATRLSGESVIVEGFGTFPLFIPLSFAMHRMYPVARLRQGIKIFDTISFAGL